MKMDATVIGREGIEKLLTMLPTEEEKVKIQEAQVPLILFEFVTTKRDVFKYLYYNFKCSSTLTRTCL